jgi:RHS repeat-associated protein
VTAITDTAGAVVQRFGYEAYGRAEVLAANWQPAADGYDWEVRYAGYRWDGESGLYQVRFRYLHPGLGRWVSRDPLGYVDGMGLYEYVGSGPLGRLDPLGLRWTWEGFFDGVIFGAGVGLGFGGLYGFAVAGPGGLALMGAIGGIAGAVIGGAVYTVDELLFAGAGPVLGPMPALPLGPQPALATPPLTDTEDESDQEGEQKKDDCPPNEEDMPEVIFDLDDYPPGGPWWKAPPFFQ